MAKARIHSFESLGTVDGPGIRFVVFMQGCPLRCLYCHNPDSWDPNSEEKKLFDEDTIVEKVKEQRRFYQPRGGVTISGGEPLLQLPFLRSLVTKLKAEHFHTAVDTSGSLFNGENEAMAEFFRSEVDLTLLDIKAFTEEEYHALTGGTLAPTLALAKFLAKHNRPLWVRYVIVPGYTNNLEKAKALAKFVGELGNVTMVEVLPFHKLGEFKWKQLGFDYKLFDTPACPPAVAKAIREIFAKEGLKVH